MAHILDRRAKAIADGLVWSIGHEYLEEDCVDLAAGIKVSVTQNRGVMKKETGGAVWDAAIVLADYIAAHPDLVRGKRVLELGAGTAFCGCAAGLAQAGDGELVVSDFPEMVDFMRSNLDRNGLKSAIAVPLVWSKQLDNDLVCDLGLFDVIIAADVIYSSEIIGALAYTMRKFLKPDGRVLFGHKVRFPWLEKTFFDVKIPKNFQSISVLVDERPSCYTKEGERVRVLQFMDPQ